jgi:hypothetical protein
MCFFDVGAARKESTVGEIVNLMSVDVQRFMDLLPYLNMLWSAPLQIVLCCIFMYQELEYSIFPGVAIMIAAIPLNGVVAGNCPKYLIFKIKRYKSLQSTLQVFDLIDA